MMRTAKYVCPRCGGKLHRDGYAASGNQRWSCREATKDSHRTYCYRTTTPGSTSVIHQSGKPEGPAPLFKRRLEPVKRYLVTAAQNATPVHSGCSKALNQAAKYYKAELLVIPLRYRNPTSRYEDKKAETDEWWDPKVVPFLWNVRRSLNKNIAVLGDIKIQPTAVEPLTGLEGFSGAESCIVGHTKLALRMVPTPGHKLPKILATTGAVTIKNYSDSRAGKHGEFHHTLGAVLVEIKGDLFWLRHLVADSDGSFTDLDKRFTPTGVYNAPPPEAIIFGDTHVDSIDPGVYRATYGHQGIVTCLKPKRLVHHDLLDSYAVNGHHSGNPFNLIAKLRSGLNDAAAEVRRAIDFVIKNTPAGAEAIIVSSNHDDMLRRYIISQDWRTDAQNAEFYLETALAMVRETKMTPSGTSYPSPFPHWVAQRKLKNIRCLERGESLSIAGIECGLHGDVGPNGARGSVRNLRRIGTKLVIGHSHSPAISEGAIQVGTSSRLQLEYNVGPSNWMHAHCLIHTGGKRQLIFIVGGEWKL
jgi:hypothetical protein